MRTRTWLSAALGATLVVYGGAELALAAPGTASPAPTTTSSSAVASSGAPSAAGASGVASAPVPTASAPVPTASAPRVAWPHRTAVTAPRADAKAAPNVSAGPPCPGHEDADYPAVCLPAGFGEDQIGQLPPGAEVEFDAQLVNGGPDYASLQFRVKLTAPLLLDGQIQLLTDWDVDGDGEDGPAVTCTSATPGSYLCTTAAIAAGANLLIVVPLEIDPTARAHDRGTISVETVPPAEGYPATSVQATAETIPTTHLELSITPGQRRVVIGHAASLTATVHNAGAATATATVVVAITVPGKGDRSHFAITNSQVSDGSAGAGGIFFGDGSSDGGAESAPSSAASTRPPAGDSSAPTVQRVTVRFGAAGADRRVAAAPDAGNGSGSVTISGAPLIGPQDTAGYVAGTIPPGGSAKITIKVRALTIGTDSLSAFTIADEPDICDVSDCADGGASARLVAVAAPKPKPKPEPKPATQTGRRLADTGPTALDAQLGVGVAALLVGGLLLGAAQLGRRRRPTCDPRH